MSYELRQIFLERDELIAALKSYARITPEFLPAGDIVDFRTEDRSHIRVLLSSAQGARTEVIFNDTKLFHAVLRFFIENNVKLPRDAQKSVVIGDGKVSLCITYDYDILCTPDEEAPSLVLTGAHAP